MVLVSGEEGEENAAPESDGPKVVAAEQVGVWEG